MVEVCDSERNGENTVVTESAARTVRPGRACRRRGWQVPPRRSPIGSKELTARCAIVAACYLRRLLPWASSCCLRHLRGKWSRANTIVGLPASKVIMVAERNPSRVARAPPGIQEVSPLFTLRKRG
jgi:hypothetical protein